MLALWLKRELPTIRGGRRMVCAHLEILRELMGLESRK
jgi:hypothetical protein